MFIGGGGVDGRCGVGGGGGRMKAGGEVMHAPSRLSLKRVGMHLH